jgi:broad specificity phosphatase PhoE
MLVIGHSLTTFIPFPCVCGNACLSTGRYDDPGTRAAAAVNPKLVVRENHGVVNDRMRAFGHWIARRPERVIAVVGHSMFIKRFTGMSRKLRNCEVHRCTVDASGRYAGVAESGITSNTNSGGVESIEMKPTRNVRNV